MRARTRCFAAVVAGATIIAPTSGFVGLPVNASEVSAAAAPVGVGRLPRNGTITGIATFGRTPTAADAAGLRALGLVVQPMRHLPLAVVRGTAAAMRTAVSTGAADDVYPDERLEHLDTRSSDTMGGAAARAAGFTGKGVTVAVVDSGCDATQPDLADHVTHNVKVVGAEYANIAPDSSNTIVVANEAGPYQNTDIGSGHGTHVAGIIAADGTTGREHLGVAPDAELVCYAIGEVLFTTAVVSAYDHMLDQPDLWGIDVVNNSWGNSYQQYDPRNPVAVATRAVADQGVTVVFAAGNAGSENGEASLNPFSQAPWVISVAAGTIGHRRGDFSSNGFTFDNSQPVGIGAGGHTSFIGDRVGVVHPDVTAPGVDIASTCDSAGTVVGPCGPGENAEASGTSMASPHVAGAVAVLRQANPSLTPDQARQALQVTATAVNGTDGETATKPLGLWQVGYGYVDLGAAVSLVRSKTFVRDLAAKQAAADRRVLRATGFAVARSDLWTCDSPRAAVGGSDGHTYTVPVASSVTHLKVTMSHPSLAQVGVNGFEYEVVVRDARGQVVVRTTEHGGLGTSSALVDLRSLRPAVAYGTFTVSVSGLLSISDPDTIDSDSLLGDTITLQLAQLRTR